MNVKGVLVVIVAAAISFGLASCGSQTSSSSASPASASSHSASNAAVVEKQPVSNSTTSASSVSSSASSSIDYAGQVSIEGEYSYENKYNAFHILVVKNNSDATLKISSNSTALDADGNLIGAGDADVSAVGPGCTSYLREMFSKVSGVSRYETSLSASVDKNASVLQSLELSATPAGKNVVVQCTNSGDSAAAFVQVLVLFFNGDTVVDSAEKYLSSNTEPLEPGDTRSEQVSTNESFDSVSAYLSGRGK